MKEVKKAEKKELSLVEVYRNEAFDIGFNSYFEDLPSNKISQVLNNKDRNIKFQTITYRQLNSWEDQGLLNSEREGGKGWRRFSVMDAIWVKIIYELREFGFPLEKIKAAKESLSHLSENCGVNMPFLEFYTAFAIGNKMPVILLVFKDGVAIPANLTQYKIANQYLGVENHLQINLNDLIQGLFPEVDLKPQYLNEIPVTVQEAELLAFIRVAEYEKIEIRYQNGQMAIISGTERINATRLIGDIIREQSYGEIKVVKSDGKTTDILVTTKKKITR